MRWSCPHCGISLAVSDDKLGTGWSFSRCYKCAGFALVRRSDVNLIKVDRAPAGEQVLLPEATEEPTAMLSQNAAQHLARYMNKKESGSTPTHKPVIRTANRRQNEAQNIQAKNTAANENTAIAATPTTTIDATIPPAFNRTKKSETPALGFLGLPEPLPEQPSRTARERLLPIAIGLTGMLAISSGIYLYIQGQALWEKARSQTTETANVGTTNENESASAKIQNENVAHASKSQIVTAAAANSLNESSEIIRAAPIAAGVANNANETSIRNPVAMTRVARAESSDQVRASAMAPARTVVEDDNAGGIFNRKAEPAAVEVTSQPRVNGKMNIKILVKSANIHSGPGMEYSTIGKVSNQKIYSVEDWRDRWFKIVIANPANNLIGKKTAWIRNDLVQTVP